MMRVRVVAFAVLLSTLAPWPAAAQAPARVDFQRDVQPILRDHCYACHGPEQQMNGFRLDRRDDAMRGGSQSVIGPGNAEGSRLYHRLVGTSVGARMPPTGPLAPEQVAVLKAWIDQGAEWPDHLAGIPPTLPVDPAADRLAGLIRSGERTQVEELLRTNPGAARGRAVRWIDAAHGRGPLRRRGPDEEADGDGSRCGRIERGGSHRVDVGPS